MAQMEPNDDEENEIGDGNVGDLELLVGLLVKVQVAVNPNEFNEEKIREMQQQAGDDQDACPKL